MSLSDLTSEAILEALLEYDEVGQAAFLSKYGFGPSKSYYLRHEGKLYDSKAIAGAAHGYLANSKPLKASAFSGGQATVAAKLEELGFEMVKDTSSGPDDAAPRSRNPSWLRDELILALDFYMNDPVSPPSKDSSEIAALSENLGKLAVLLGFTPTADHRNRNGVYMKVMNFRRFDPTFSALGKVGLSHGSTGDGEVWEEFANDRARLQAAAALIRDAINGGVSVEPFEEPFIEEAAEGRVFTASHLKRERSRKLIEDKKRKALLAGELRCEGCGISFEEVYGDHGQGFIEVHHTRPVHTLSKDGGTTRLEDLALVCPNCHRMIHRKRDWLTMQQLREMVASTRLGRSGE